MGSEPTTHGNANTLETYRRDWKTYLERTIASHLRYHGDWLPRALELRPTDDPVLEIGSGPGHWSRILEEVGARVQRSDAVPEFVAHLQSQGYEALHLNLLRDQLTGVYSMVLMVAVIQHFTPAEAAEALSRCAAVLPPGGVLAFSARHGEGTRWMHLRGMGPRRFTFWQPRPLWELVERSGFSMHAMYFDSHWSDQERQYKDWLLVTAVKP